MFAYRHFSELINAVSRKKSDRDKSIIKKSNSIIWFLFVQLAVKLEFKFDSIRQLKSKKKFENLLRDFLLSITEYLLDQQLVQQLVQQLRCSITTKSDIVFNNKKLSLINNEFKLDLRYRYRRSYKVLQRKTQKSIYIR